MKKRNSVSQHMNKFNRGGKHRDKKKDYSRVDEKRNLMRYIKA